MRFGVWQIIGGIALAGAAVGTGYLISKVITEDDVPELGKLAIDGVNELAQRSPLSDSEKAAVEVVAKTANAGIDIMDYQFRR